MALHCTGKYQSYDDSYNAAVQSLESGKAWKGLELLIGLQ